MTEDEKAPAPSPSLFVKKVSLNLKSRYKGKKINNGTSKAFQPFFKVSPIFGISSLGTGLTLYLRQNKNRVINLCNINQITTPHTAIQKDDISYWSGNTVSKAAKANNMVPEGGIIGPNELADISTVAAKCLGKPVLIIDGIVNTPVAATFPGPVPDKAAINVLDSKLT